MVSITLPDGSQKQFENAPTVQDVAASIGAGLAKAALAGKVDGKLVDTSYRVDHDAKLEIVTEKSPDALDIIRHSTAHLLAQATQRLFPDTQVTIGPVVENGFYYDFARKTPFTPDDLTKIEAEMKKIAAENMPVQRSVMAKDDAIRFFKDKGEIYKAEIIDDIIPPGEEISLYGQGEWVDLCRGPHVPSTGKLKAFKLMKVAGAYWRGDQNNEMLQRVYGTAWTEREGSQRRICISLRKPRSAITASSASSSIFSICRTRRRASCSGIRRAGRSGRWSSSTCAASIVKAAITKCAVRRFSTSRCGKKPATGRTTARTCSPRSRRKREYALKPMNCPGHVLVYNHGLHSYRELPIRYGEFGSCVRNEPSGALHGLMRVRGFVQDDGHIFCTESQIESEVVAFHRQAMKVYSDFGFSDIALKIALRPESRIGSDEVWNKAEAALRDALRICNVEWHELPGEGAFYGPKIEYHMKDSLGRAWQVGTMQVDFSMPGRLGAEYVGEDSARHVPVMLHRAIVGSMERFIGILIEHHAGNFPAWLAPVQAVVMNITDAQADYAAQVAKTLVKQGFRVENDLRNEKIGYKIREHTLQKVPFLLVVGDREKENGVVAVRARSGEDLGSLPLTAFVEKLQADRLG